MPTLQTDFDRIAAALHKRASIVDGHCDTPYRLARMNARLADHDHRAHVDLDALESSGLTASFFAAYVPPHYAGRGAAAFAHKLIDIIDAEAAGHGLLMRADSTDGIRYAHAAGKVALLVGVEGGHAIENSLDELRHLHARGARYMTLTHVNTNDWCDSSGDIARHGGLTRFGRDVVSTMNDLGMIVDVSHISDAAFFDVLETTRVPVIASHSSCRALTTHPRNMTDEMLRALAANGGVCMINFFSAFVNQQVATALTAAQAQSPRAHIAEDESLLPDDREDWDSYLQWFSTLGCPEADLQDVVAHVMHAVETAGVDHVGIGSDFDGVPALPRGLTHLSMLPRLSAALLERGLSEQDLEKILGSNFMRVFETVEGGIG